MTLLTTLLDMTGESKIPYHAKAYFGYRARVIKTNEFLRILNLPRRQWEIEPFLKKTTTTLTEILKTPTGKMTLWPIQAISLLEIGVYDGGFLPIGVGQGKALISLLTPTVLKAQKPLLLVPAQLRDQTKNYVIPEMSNHWKLDTNLTIKGYEEISLEKNKDFLQTMKPDVIILDECHRCKSKQAGRTKRLIRYFRQYPKTKCVAMSGTIATRSLKDWAHISEWCLKERTPVPRKWTELTEWADAIDENVPDEQKVAPGILVQFCKPFENIRQGFCRRINETPGIVSSKEDDLTMSLNLSYLKPKLPNEITNSIKRLRASWEAPNGDYLVNAVDLWRHARELALGFWYKWDPSPPEEWMIARREWKSYVREVLKHNRRGLDTELQVWNASDCEQKEKWKGIKDTFKPNVIAEWISDFPLNYCKKWLNGEGIVWISHTAFGKKLSKETNVPFFGAGDDSIIDTKETAIIASISAHGEGKNLQRFDRNLVMCPPTSGKIWEQLLGRTHRKGQKSDEVVCDIWLPIAELVNSFEQALSDARYLEDTYGNRQKLNYATITRHN